MKIEYTYSKEVQKCLDQMENALHYYTDQLTHQLYAEGNPRHIVERMVKNDKQRKELITHMLHLERSSLPTITVIL